MNTNISKFLYLGVGMMLFALALTVFFSNYHSFQAYIDTSIHATKQDKVVSISEEDPYTFIQGCELIHIILENQKRIEVEELTKDYYNIDPSSQDSFCIWVCGHDVSLIDPSKIDPFALFKASYQLDTDGKITDIYYSLK